MARIRSIHPGIFTDEAFVTVSPLARVLLFGIWTEADDHGSFDWKPLTFKMRLLPADSADVAALLEELLAVDAVKKVDIEGKATGLVRNFCRFQNPIHPSYRVTIPPEYRHYIGLNADGSVPNRQSSPTPPPVLPDKAPTPPETLPLRERRGGNRNRRGEEPKPETISESVVVVVPEKHDDDPKAQDGLVGKQDRVGDALERSGFDRKTGALPDPVDFNPLGTTLPEDWTPGTGDVATAAAYGLDDDAIRAELLKFHAYNAQNGTFSKNWPATWQLWCARWKEREAAKPKPPPARVEVDNKPTADNWDKACALWAKGTSAWPRKSLGPEPGQPNCRCPVIFLTKHNIDPETGRMVAPSKEPVS